MNRVKKTTKSFLRNILLIAIFTFALLLRVVGTFPGYPPYHSDEGISYSAAVSMIKGQNWDPLRYDYPAVVPLVNYLSFKNIFIPLAWMKYYITNLPKIVDGYVKLPLPKEESDRVFQLDILGNQERNALIWGRITTAFVGFGSIVALYFLGKKLFNRRVAVAACVFAAVNYRLVLNSHFGLPDTYNSFFLLLSLITSWNLYQKPVFKNYFIASLFAGLSLATKYQPFGLLSLITVHAFLSLSAKSNSKRIKVMFSRGAMIVPFVIIFVFLSLNPYALIKLEETRDWLVFVASKYGPGRNVLGIYALSYLYHTGIGMFLAILSIVGVCFGLIKYRIQTVFLLSSVVPFFYITTYYSGAGFYTRNFVTIIPLLLVFPALVLSALFVKFKSRLVIVLIVLCAVFISYDQLKLSETVAFEYTKPWNYEVLSAWLAKKIPESSKVSAHSSVPLPIKNVTRFTYDFHLDFSKEEFRLAGAQYAIANLDWETNDFYWWMTQSLKSGVGYWERPTSVLEQSYTAMSLRELEQYSIYSTINPWPAPDSNFIVAKIPAVTYKKGDLLIKDRFDDLNEWHQEGQFDDDSENLVHKDQSLGILQGSPKSPVKRWQTKVLPVPNSGGILIEGKMKTDNPKVKDGFIFVKYFKTEEDANTNTNRIAVNLSARNENNDKWNAVSFTSVPPDGAHFMVIGFQVYDASLGNVFLDDISIYRAEVTEDFSGWKLNPIKLEENVIFPLSHGYL